MKKPMYKRPVFWIVTMVGVLVVDAAQTLAVRSWLQARTHRLETAVGMLRIQPRPMPRGAQAAVPARKPGEWQVARPDGALLQELPGKVAILPTKFTSATAPGGMAGGGWMMRAQQKAAGTRVPVDSILCAAYEWDSQTRMILPEGMPTGQYDFIASLPTGALEALQKEIEQKFKLSAQQETRPLDGLALKVDHTDAPGLKSSADSRRSARNENGVIVYSGVPISLVVAVLESMLRKPVVDQTGLSGRYDIRLPMARITAGGLGPQMLEQARRALMEELGFDLVPTNTPMQVLVVRNSK